MRGGPVPARARPRGRGARAGRRERAATQYKAVPFPAPARRTRSRLSEFPLFTVRVLSHQKLCTSHTSQATLHFTHTYRTRTRTQPASQSQSGAFACAHKSQLVPRHRPRPRPDTPRRCCQPTAQSLAMGAQPRRHTHYQPTNVLCSSSAISVTTRRTQPRKASQSSGRGGRTQTPRCTLTCLWRACCRPCRPCGF